MKKHIFVILLLSSYFSFSQEVKDFKKKTENNALERTEILDLLRTEIKKDINQDVQFVVKHLKVSGKYAWFEGEALRKDGKKIEFPDDSYECCDVGGLFLKKKENGQLYKVELFQLIVGIAKSLINTLIYLK